MGVGIVGIVLTAKQAQNGVAWRGITSSSLSNFHFVPKGLGSNESMTFTQD